MESLNRQKNEQINAAIHSVIIQNILDSLPLGVLVINPEGDITFTNASSHEILGFESDVFTHQGWGEIFFDMEKNIEFNQVVIDAIREKKVNLHKEVPYLRPTGEKRLFSMTTSLLHDKGQVVGLVILLADVTEIHQARFREKVVLEEKNRVQRERVEGLRHLALSVAHQIRNPVASIGGFASRMLKKVDSKDPNRPYLQSILQGTKRLEDMVNAVRDYAGISPVLSRRIRLSRLVETVHERLDRKALEYAKTIQWVVRVPPFELYADPDLLLQALEEIVLNAVESFPRDQGRVEIRASIKMQVIRLSIMDSGAGIPEKDLSYIFDPFFTTKPSSVGIGLCKAGRIIKEHKGEITVSSRVGKGTVVDIRLPV